MHFRVSDEFFCPAGSAGQKCESVAARLHLWINEGSSKFKISLPHEMFTPFNFYPLKFEDHFTET